jgi:C4-type Zn-finger protein
VKRAADVGAKSEINPKGIPYKDLKADLQDLVRRGQASKIKLPAIEEHVQEAKRLVAFWTRHEAAAHCFKSMAVTMAEAGAEHAKKQEQAMMEHLADLEIWEAYLSIEIMKTKPFNLAGRSLHLLVDIADT